MEITQAYILGVQEGRDLLRANPDLDIAAHIENLKHLICIHAGSMKQAFKGELDFFKNQQKKAS